MAWTKTWMPSHARPEAKWRDSTNDNHLQVLESILHCHLLNDKFSHSIMPSPGTRLALCRRPSLPEAGWSMGTSKIGNTAVVITRSIISEDYNMMYTYWMMNNYWLSIHTVNQLFAAKAWADHIANYSRLSILPPIDHSTSGWPLLRFVVVDNLDMRLDAPEMLPRCK